MPIIFKKAGFLIPMILDYFKHDIEISLSHVLIKNIYIVKSSVCCII